MVLIARKTNTSSSHTPQCTYNRVPMKTCQSNDKLSINLLPAHNWLRLYVTSFAPLTHTCTDSTDRQLTVQLLFTCISLSQFGYILATWRKNLPRRQKGNRATSLRKKKQQQQQWSALYTHADICHR
jgi:hypothetical protein